MIKAYQDKLDIPVGLSSSAKFQMTYLSKSLLLNYVLRG